MNLPKPFIPGPQTPPNPFQGLVSVIVPAYNCAATLPRCIESLQKQTYSNLEIIVVDDASTDHTPDVVARYQVTFIRHPENRGEGATRNAGAAAAHGEIFFFTDADGYYDPDYVEKLLRYLHLPNVWGAMNVGRRVWTERKNALVRWQNYLFQAMEQRILGGRRGTGAWAFPRWAFENLGGYDPTLRIGTDVDLVLRLIKAGGRIVLGGRSYLHHKDPDTMRVYLRRAYRGARYSGIFRARWHGMKGWSKAISYCARFLLLALWPLYPILALAWHPIFWLGFLGALGYLMGEDMTTLQGWGRSLSSRDIVTFLAAPCLLYLRRSAIGVGRIRSFFD